MIHMLFFAYLDLTKKNDNLVLRVVIKITI
jgi:hypothetical protein